MICVSSQCACAEAISGTKRRPASHVGHKRLKKRHVRLSLGSAVLPMGVRKKSKMAAIWGVILSYL